MTNSHNNKHDSNHNNHKDTSNKSNPENLNHDKSHNPDKNNTHNNIKDHNLNDTNSKKSFSSDTDDATRNGANTAHILKAGTKSEDTDSGSTLRSNKPTSDGDELDDDSDDTTNRMNNKKS